MAHQNPQDVELRRLLESTQTIAVVGASSDPDKAAHHIPRLLQRGGYRIVPVNPNESRLFGERVYPSLDTVTERIDVVNVFRPIEEAPSIAQAAIRIGAKVLWLQQGLVSEEAAQIARSAGLTVIMDRCLGTTWRRLGPHEDGRTSSSHGAGGV